MEALKRHLPPGLLALILLRAAISLCFLASDPRRYWNWEEAWPATEAWFLLHAGLWDRLLHLQYKAFCGGCTVHALTAVPVLGLFGDSFLAWKGIALAWEAAITALGFAALQRHVNRPAAWIFALLYSLPPVGLLEVDLMQWGNHREALLWLVLGLCLLERPFALGLMCGFALWFGRTSLHISLVLLPLCLWRTHSWRAVLGFGLGLTLFLPEWGDGQEGTYKMGVGDNLAPEGLGVVPSRLAALLHPSIFGQYLHLGTTSPALPAALLLGGAAVCAPFVKPRWLLAFPVVFALAWGISGFDVQEIQLRSPPGQARYHAPWIAELLLVMAAGTGSLWVKGRRGPAALLAALLLGANLLPYAERLPSPQWAALGRMGIVHLPRFASMAWRRVGLERLRETSSEDASVEATLRRMEGYALWADRGAAALGQTEDPQVLEGLGQAMIDPRGRIEQGRAAMAKEPRLARGMAWNLAFAGPEAEPEKTNAAAFSAEIAAEPGCARCASLGVLAASKCSRALENPQAYQDCLRGRLDPLGDEAWLGAGVGCRRPWEDPLPCREAAEGLPSPFAVGLDDPMAGVDFAFMPPKPGSSRVSAPR